MLLSWVYRFILMRTFIRKFKSIKSTHLCTIINYFISLYLDDLLTRFFIFSSFVVGVLFRNSINWTSPLGNYVSNFLWRFGIQECLTTHSYFFQSLCYETLWVCLFYSTFLNWVKFIWEFLFLWSCCRINISLLCWSFLLTFEIILYLLLSNIIFCRFDL